MYLKILSLLVLLVARDQSDSVFSITLVHRLGKVVGRSPWITILVCVILSGACMVGMLNFTQESRAEKLWSPQDSPASRHQAWVQEKFPTSSRFSNVLLVAKDILIPEVFVEVSAMLYAI